MNKQENFKALVDKAMRENKLRHMRPVVEKELLHYDILFALDKQGLLDTLTFQGGTALRLCCGAPRFSEDLDFAGGREFYRQDIMQVKQCIEQYIGERYGLEVLVKEPKELLAERENDYIKVEKWQVSVTTAPEQRDIPRQKIKVEIVNVPSYTREPMTLKQNYDFLPDGYSDTFIYCESLDEILADKLIAYVNCRRYVRYRDIWDMRWLKQKGASLQESLVKEKIKDYNITDYPSRLNDAMGSLQEVIYSDGFRQQMSRFIPSDVQANTLMKEKFYNHLNVELAALFQQLRMLLN